MDKATWTSELADATVPAVTPEHTPDNTLTHGESFPGEPPYHETGLYMVGRPDWERRYPVFDSYIKSPMQLGTARVVLAELALDDRHELPQHRYRLYEVSIKEIRNG